MNLLERLNRFLLRRTAADHPLTEKERQEKPPTTALDETFRTAQGIFGESVGGDRNDGSPRSG
jgi:hypothetical protein